jgi:L-iditol 2-dehydrogenase
MTAAYLTGPSRLELRTVSTPRVNAGEILLRVRAVGLCGSDARIFVQGSPRVTYPAVVGHEIAGEIVSIGAGVRGWKAGDRLALGSQVPCGRCTACRAKAENLCESAEMVGYQRPGGLAAHLLLTKDVLTRGQIAKLPAGLDFDTASLAEPLAAVLNGFERMGGVKGRVLAILGSGGAAHLATVAADALGAKRVVVCGRSAALRGGVAAKLADVVASSDSFEENRRALRRASPGGFERIFVASDNAAMPTLAVSLLAARGTAVLFGVTPRGEMARINANDLHYNEASLVGCFGSTPRHFAEAVKLLAKRRADFAKLVTHRFPLSRIHTAYGAMADKRRIKVVVNP